MINFEPSKDALSLNIRESKCGNAIYKDRQCYTQHHITGNSRLGDSSILYTPNLLSALRDYRDIRNRKMKLGYLNFTPSNSLRIYHEHPVINSRIGRLEKIMTEALFFCYA